jgi:hypothetical protein
MGGYVEQQPTGRAVRISAILLLNRCDAVRSWRSSETKEQEDEDTLAYPTI